MSRGPTGTLKEQLARATKVAAEAQAAVDRLLAVNNKIERARDTRRKVLLGGALIAQARQDARAAAQIEAMVLGMRKADQEPFTGWTATGPQADEPVVTSEVVEAVPQDQSQPEEAAVTSDPLELVHQNQPEQHHVG